MKRLIFDIVYRDKGWHIDLRLCGFEKPDKPRVVYTVKHMAVQNAVTICNCLWYDAGIPCQLVIHKKDGSIQEERTYPDYTPEWKG